MSWEVNCPYCGTKNEMHTDYLEGGSNFDHECDACEKEFEVETEWDPTFSASKIEYVDCDVCGKQTREICTNKTRFPFPIKYADKKLCHACWFKGITEQMKSEEELPDIHPGD